MLYHIHTYPLVSWMWTAYQSKMHRQHDWQQVWTVEQSAAWATSPSWLWQRTHVTSSLLHRSARHLPSELQLYHTTYISEVNLGLQIHICQYQCVCVSIITIIQLLSNVKYSTSTTHLADSKWETNQVDLLDYAWTEHGAATELRDWGTAACQALLCDTQRTASNKRISLTLHCAITCEQYSWDSKQLAVK